MEQSFRVSRKENPEELNNDKDIDKISILLFLHMFLSHEVHELPDQLWHQQIERRRDDGDYYAHNDVT